MKPSSVSDVIVSVLLIVVCVAFCVAISVWATGCNGLASRSSVPVAEHGTEQACVESCREYDDAYLVYYALGMTFSGTTAAAGTSGVLSATLADEPGADIALAATAAGSGIATVVFNWLAGEAAERYTDCVDRCRSEQQRVTAAHE